MTYSEKYLERHDNLIPLYQVMGNDVLYNRFHGNTEEVYKYCLEHNTRWESVLRYEYNPDVIY